MDDATLQSIRERAHQPDDPDLVGRALKDAKKDIGRLLDTPQPQRRVLVTVKSYDHNGDLEDVASFDGPEEAVKTALACLFHPQTWMTGIPTDGD